MVMCVHIRNLSTAVQEFEPVILVHSSNHAELTHYSRHEIHCWIMGDIRSGSRLVITRPKQLPMARDGGEEGMRKGREARIWEGGEGEEERVRERGSGE